MSEFHLEGTTMMAIMRLVPLVLAFILGRWALRKLRESTFEPLALVSLIATALSLRLVFEVNLWGYYLMAVAVLTIFQDVLRHRLRVELLAWLAVATIAYDPIPWGFNPLRYNTPFWVWQLLLCPTGAALAFAPLLTLIRQRGRQNGKSTIGPQSLGSRICRIQTWRLTRARSSSFASSAHYLSK